MSLAISAIAIAGVGALIHTEATADTGVVLQKKEELVTPCLGHVVYWCCVLRKMRNSRGNFQITYHTTIAAPTKSTTIITQASAQIDVAHVIWPATIESTAFGPEGLFTTTERTTNLTALAGSLEVVGINNSKEGSEQDSDRAELHVCG